MNHPGSIPARASQSSPATHRSQRRAVGWFAACLLAAAPIASATSYRVGAEDSQLRFSSAVSGERFEGHFSRFGGSIQFDPATLADTRFDITIEVSSVDTDSEERDEVLVSPEWFDPEGHPQARFVASGAVADGDGYVSEGQLSLRGLSQPVRFHFQLSPDGQRLQGHADLNRLDWQLGGEEWADDELVAYGVRVEVDVVLRAVPATSSSSS